LDQFRVSGQGAVRPLKGQVYFLMDVAQKCAAVLGQRHAWKQKLKARRLNLFSARRA
jgi:hypothetical protein